MFTLSFLYYYISVIVLVNTVDRDDNDNVKVCSMVNSSFDLKEGILGEVAEFPWMGVLRMPIKEVDQPMKIVATGVALVTVKHVIVNADDVYRTSKARLVRDAKVHFIPVAGQPWSARPKDLTIHPEYEYATTNTIAIIELNMETEDDEDKNIHNPYLKPVCWPGIAFNASNALYIAGYTDERMVLEKEFFMAQYVPKDICNEFYKRSYLNVDKMEEPKSYVCSFAKNKKQNCQWDNGMLLVSNVTGHWTLVGFGVGGPGCSAPARFIDYSSYIDWIKMASADPLIYDYYGGDRQYKDISY